MKNIYFSGLVKCNSKKVLRLRGVLFTYSHPILAHLTTHPVAKPPVSNVPKKTKIEGTSARQAKERIRIKFLKYGEFLENVGIADK